MAEVVQTTWRARRSDSTLAVAGGRPSLRVLHLGVPRRNIRWEDFGARWPRRAPPVRTAQVWGVAARNRRTRTAAPPAPMATDVAAKATPVIDPDARPLPSSA